VTDPFRVEPKPGPMGQDPLLTVATKFDNHLIKLQNIALEGLSCSYNNLLSIN